MAHCLLHGITYEASQGCSRCRASAHAWGNDVSMVKPTATPSVTELSPNPKQAFGDKKVPLGLVPSSALIYLGRSFKEGARKYGPLNWRVTKVEAMTYVHAALRHIYSYVDGEDIDPESNNPHIAHAMACLAILADATETDNLIDNRPTPGRAGALLRKEAT